MRLLDLFCGAGGCAVGYHRAGFADIVGVDIEPQPRYPFTFMEADAVAVLRHLVNGGRIRPDIMRDEPTFSLEDFDAIHASPPCQAFSAMKEMKNAREHSDLLTPTRDLLLGVQKPWVIENVVGAPMKDQPPDLFDPLCGITLCGSMFDLNNGSHELRRHRLFESNICLRAPKCRHRLPVIGFYGDHARTRQRVSGHKDRGTDIVGNDKKLALVRNLMGIDWMTWEEATLAIPPAYTEFIGRQLIDWLKE